MAINETDIVVPVENPQEFILSKEITLLYRRGRMFIDGAISEQELGGGLYSVIFFLKTHNGSSQEEISKNMEIEKTTLTRGLSRLEEQGYIARKVDEKDRRVNRVFLTEKGFNALPKLHEYSSQWQEVLTTGFTSAERAELERLVKKMSENAQTYRNNRCKKGGIHDK